VSPEEKPPIDLSTLIAAGRSPWSDVSDQLIERADPMGFLRVLAEAGTQALRHPAEVGAASMRFLSRAAQVGPVAVAKQLGQDRPDVIDVPARDRRFADPLWTQNPLYYMVQQLYLLHGELVTDIVGTADLEPERQRKADFAAQLLVNALAPTNTLLGNPAALKRAYETRGDSVIRGSRNFLDDLINNSGRPRQVDASGFEVGVNMAVTPGKVVYRSDLIELIQYEAQTDEVYETPLLFCPPWINKYYIMDLAPGRSLIEWAVQHGHTCFAISYRNPDESMAETSFEDYLFGGPLTAAKVACEITGASSVNTLSVCLGGTLTAMAMAQEVNQHTSLIKTATFINTHTDFELSGALGAFTDEAAVSSMEKRMTKKGYLEASEMASTFDSLRANDLIFQYVASNWLQGEDPVAFDLLAWNADATRMPARMHTSYLRSCYIENRFARGKLRVHDKKLKPAKIERDTFVLSAVDDHIVPWESAYRTVHVLGGDSTFVLSTAGHIAGIVNPPGPKSKHWTNSDLPEDPAEWLEGAQLHDETWWQEWSRWIAKRGGGRRDPYQVGSLEHPVLGAAPGVYVSAKS
jgi:polyhydroxyalkanoate synthase subunit PhaC